MFMNNNCLFHMCDITLPHKQWSHPDGARIICNNFEDLLI